MLTQAAIGTGNASAPTSEATTSTINGSASHPARYEELRDQYKSLMNEIVCFYPEGDARIEFRQKLFESTASLYIARLAHEQFKQHILQLEAELQQKEAMLQAQYKRAQVTANLIMSLRKNVNEQGSKYVHGEYRSNNCIISVTFRSCKRGCSAFIASTSTQNTEAQSWHSLFKQVKTPLQLQQRFSSRVLSRQQ
ncbi:hypothetical protein AAVH_23168, partial [Aphelenchoides avenae]